MCGIAGWSVLPGHEPAQGALDSMTLAIRHRGPDDMGSYRAPDSGLAMGHRRLSIIDLSPDSHQPMVDAASGVVLAFNGEIYNFHALRRELRASGVVFRSSGDTEVLLQAYLQWGLACLTRLAGMFAFAIWDPRAAELHLVRDSSGMKPLYVAQIADGIAFASEVKAFLALPGFDARLDPVGVQQFLEFGYVFDLHRSSLQGVEKLAPGERWTIKAGRIVVRDVWFTPPAPSPDDARGLDQRVGQLGEVLDEVVGEHLIADVPVGLLLSGGLDSSVIAALAARRGALTTFCMGFDRSYVDEREQARAVARHIGSHHIDVLIDSAEVRAEVERGAWVFDDLFGDWGTITTRLLYRRCREAGVKVVLVGEGADELFGGYDVFQQPDGLGLWGQFKLYRRYSGRRHGRLFGQFREAMQEYLAAGSGDAFHAVRLFESRRQLPNNYVMKVDKASMAESVEARAPYLDRRVADLAWRTPREWLYRNGENKYLLRALAHRNGLLPAATAGRIKFGAPLAASWMDDDPGFRAFARERILGPDSQTEKLGLADPMRAYFDQGRVGYRWPAELSLFRNLAWRLLLLELWSTFYLGTGTPAVPESRPLIASKR